MNLDSVGFFLSLYVFPAYQILDSQSCQWYLPCEHSQIPNSPNAFKARYSRMVGLSWNIMKRAASAGVSSVVVNMIKYHGHRVLSHGDDEFALTADIKPPPKNAAHDVVERRRLQMAAQPHNAHLVRRAAILRGAKRWVAEIQNSPFGANPIARPNMSVATRDQMWWRRGWSWRPWVPWHHECEPAMGKATAHIDKASYYAESTRPRNGGAALRSGQPQPQGHQQICRV